MADDRGPFGDALAQQFRSDPFGGGRLFHLVGDDALAGGFKLSHFKPQGVGSREPGESAGASAD